MVSQQRKAKEPRQVGRRACIVARHGCHPQSHCHWFQEKEIEICTFKEQKIWQLIPCAWSSKTRLSKYTLCNEEWCRQGQHSHLGKQHYHLHGHFWSAPVKIISEFCIDLATYISSSINLKPNWKFPSWPNTMGEFSYHRMKPQVIIARMLFIGFISNRSRCNVNFFGNSSYVPRNINSTKGAAYQNYNLCKAGNEQY
jgi:hypothetical protein